MSQMINRYHLTGTKSTTTTTNTTNVKIPTAVDGVLAILQKRRSGAMLPLSSTNNNTAPPPSRRSDNDGDLSVPSHTLLSSSSSSVSKAREGEVSLVPSSKVNYILHDTLSKADRNYISSVSKSELSQQNHYLGYEDVDHIRWQRDVLLEHHTSLLTLARMAIFSMCIQPPRDNSVDNVSGRGDEGRNTPSRNRSDQVHNYSTTTATTFPNTDAAFKSLLTQLRLVTAERDEACRLWRLVSQENATLRDELIAAALLVKNHNTNYTEATGSSVVNINNSGDPYADIKDCYINRHIQRSDLSMHLKGYYNTPSVQTMTKTKMEMVEPKKQQLQQNLISNVIEISTATDAPRESSSSSQAHLLNKCSLTVVASETNDDSACKNVIEKKQQLQSDLYDNTSLCHADALDRHESWEVHNWGHVVIDHHRMNNHQIIPSRNCVGCSEAVIVGEHQRVGGSGNTSLQLLEELSSIDVDTINNNNDTLNLSPRRVFGLGQHRRGSVSSIKPTIPPREQPFNFIGLPLSNVPGITLLRKILEILKQNSNNGECDIENGTDSDIDKSNIHSVSMRHKHSSTAAYGGVRTGGVCNYLPGVHFVPPVSNSEVKQLQQHIISLLFGETYVPPSAHSSLYNNNSAVVSTNDVAPSSSSVVGFSSPDRVLRPKGGEGIIGNARINMRGKVMIWDDFVGRWCKKHLLLMDTTTGLLVCEDEGIVTPSMSKKTKNCSSSAVVVLSTYCPHLLALIGRHPQLQGLLQAAVVMYCSALAQRVLVTQRSVATNATTTTINTNNNPTTTNNNAPNVQQQDAEVSRVIRLLNTIATLAGQNNNNNNNTILLSPTQQCRLSQAKIKLFEAAMKEYVALSPVIVNSGASPLLRATLVGDIGDRSSDSSKLFYVSVTARVVTGGKNSLNKTSESNDYICLNNTDTTTTVVVDAVVAPPAAAAAASPSTTVTLVEQFKCNSTLECTRWVRTLQTALSL